MILSLLFIIILHADQSILIFFTFLLSSSVFRVWHHPVSSWYSLDCIIWFVLSWSYVSSSSSILISSSHPISSSSIHLPPLPDCSYAWPRGIQGASYIFLGHAIVTILVHFGQFWCTSWVTPRPLFIEFPSSHQRYVSYA